MVLKEKERTCLCVCVCVTLLICETVGGIVVIKLLSALTVALKQEVIPAGFALFQWKKLTIIAISRSLCILVLFHVTLRSILVSSILIV